MSSTTGGSAPTSDPLLTFMFAIDGTIKLSSGDLPLDGYFTEISGLSEETEVVALKSVTPAGNEIGKPMKFTLPGRISREPITLKRGLTTDLTFWHWWGLVKQGDMQAARTNISITMYNRQLVPVIKWDLTEAWPSSIVMPDFSGGESDFGVEELTLTYKSLAFEQLPDP